MSIFAKTIDSGTCSVSNHPFQLGILKKSQWQLSDQFQHKIHDLLPESEKAFTLIRTHAELQKCSILAFLLDNVYVGQVMLLNPKQGEANALLGWQNPPPNENLSVMEGLSVLPDYRKHGIGSYLANSWYQTATENGKTAAAEVEITNAASLSLQFKNGAYLTAAAIHPVDGAPVAYTVKPPVLPTVTPEQITVNFQDITVPAVQKHLSNGYIGTGIQKYAAGSALVFQKTREKE